MVSYMVQGRTTNAPLAAVTDNTQKTALMLNRLWLSSVDCLQSASIDERPVFHEPPFLYFPGEKYPLTAEEGMLYNLPSFPH